MKTIHCIQTLASVLLALLLVACGPGEESPGEPRATASGVSPEIAAVLLDSEPPGAVSVMEARRTAGPGTAVTVVGRIAGALEPFTEGYAIFVLADNSLATCDRNPGDSCTTPWDACCETPETIKASRLSVQIIGDDGRPVEQGLKGVAGMTELDELVVTGTVTEGSTPENCIIEAAGIFRKSS